MRRSKSGNNCCWEAAILLMVHSNTHGAKGDNGRPRVHEKVIEESELQQERGEMAGSGVQRQHLAVATEKGDGSDSSEFELQCDQDFALHVENFGPVVRVVCDVHKLVYGLRRHLLVLAGDKQARNTDQLQFTTVNGFVTQKAIQKINGKIQCFVLQMVLKRLPWGNTNHRPTRREFRHLMRKSPA